jgi:hypothetical protein
MKSTFFVLIVLCILSNSYSQDYDLIVNTKEDSIACFIDSIADSIIYFKMIHNDHWIHTIINKNDVIEYKYNAIEKNLVVFKPGSSYIEYVYNENDENMLKAIKYAKTGKTLMIAGCATTGAGVLWGITDPLGHELGTICEAGIPIIVGLASLVVGGSLKSIGKNRYNRINASKNSSYDGIKIDLKPYAQYLNNQNYQPGLTLRISF